MGAKVSVEMKGIPLLSKGLRLISKRASKANINATLEASKSILEDAKASMRGPKSGRVYGTHQASAPGESPAIDTAELYESGKVVVDKISRTQAVADVVFDADHAKYMEFGTIDIEPRPYLGPAFAKNKKGIKQSYAEAINGATRAG